MSPPTQHNLPDVMDAKVGVSAELPHAVARPEQARQGTKRSTRLGFLLVLQFLGELSEGQHRFLLREQSQVKLEELHRAIDLFGRLLASPRSLARSRAALDEALSGCPHLDAKSVLREQRRIGVGYRDKGSLRPPHQRRLVSGRSWWSEDIAPALLSVPEEPRWISADEVFGEDRYSVIQELALRTLLINSKPPYPSWED